VSVSITNRRRRMVTLLVPEERGVRVVRIAHGHTESGLPDAVLKLPAVLQAQASGEFVVRHEPVSKVLGGKR
jgi:hypothetical protein